MRLNSRIYVLLMASFTFLNCKSSKGDYSNIKFKGEDSIQIIISDSAPPSVVLAASELLGFLKQVSDGEMIISNDLKNHFHKTIFLGESDPLENLGIKLNNHKRDEFSIISIDNGLVLTGNDQVFKPRPPFSRNRKSAKKAGKEWYRIIDKEWRNPLGQIYKAYNPSLNLWEYDSKGTLNAVYYYLNSIGYRWFAPGKVGEVIPELDSLPFSGYNVNHSGALPLRNLYFGGRRFYQASKDDILWYIRLGLSSGPDILGHSPPGHGLNNVISNKKQFKAYPEMFAMADHRRVFKKKNKIIPCLTSKKLIEECVAYSRAVFDIYDEPSISLMPPDGFSFVCEHEECQKKITLDRGDRGMYSDYVWGFINTVAKELYKSHPSKKISCFAYSTYLLPPRNINQLSPNVLVGITRKRRLFHDRKIHLYYQGIHKQWIEKIPSKKIIYWDYYLEADPIREEFGLPVIYSNIIDKDIKANKDELLGEFIEVYRVLPPDSKSIVDLAISHFNIYTTSKLYQDPQLNLEKLKEDYFIKYYGKANNLMKELFSLSEDSWFNLLYDNEKLSRVNLLIESALKEKITQVQKERILLIKRYLSPLKRLRTLKDLRKPMSKITPARALNRVGSDFILDGKLNDKLWKGTSKYILKDINATKMKSENVVMFAFNKENLLIGCDFNLYQKIVDDQIVLNLKTLDGNSITLKLSKRGDVEINGIKNKQLIKRKIAQSKDSWSLEIQIPYKTYKLGKNNLENAIFYRPNRTFPLVFNLFREVKFKNKRNLSFAYHHDRDSKIKYSEQFSELIFR